jgi:16S rRNA (guanine966-N2)-methyltransferase
MRIIGGKYRGRKLVDCKNLNLRPTSDKNRENLFNILKNNPALQEFDIENCNFLDVFCGSGAVSFEAISRGAQSATLIDINKNHLEAAQTNSQNFDTKNIQYHQIDITKTIFKSPKKHNIIFLDPPYDKNLTVKAAQNLQKYDWLAENSLMIIEYHQNEDLSALEESFELLERRGYKETVFGFYVRKI